ncbi:24433_t:CDS:2 [Dentiscutata erythropus]|uniref:24433_t:CDS:1 n=1 Tax=Dentiscutata erythropus TaxID=1348616 RepID=A0A9N9BIY9_9GLOM|nr:24433_t:CDS:2 [Dentiscutata erythropus]
MVTIRRLPYFVDPEGVNFAYYTLIQTQQWSNIPIFVNFFQDLTKSSVFRPWNDNAPCWKYAVGGLNLEGYCKNNL